MINLKLWDITFNCLVNLKNVNKEGFYIQELF